MNPRSVAAKIIIKIIEYIISIVFENVAFISVILSIVEISSSSVRDLSTLLFVSTPVGIKSYSRLSNTSLFIAIPCTDGSL